MNEQFARTALVYGEDAIKVLSTKRVAVFGLGGVGGYVVEALVRSGVGHFDLYDFDTISASNINRQIIATHETVGRKKIEVMKERMLSINPNVDVNIFDCFVLPEQLPTLSLDKCDYLVDAIDTVTTKIALIVEAKRLNIPIISCMGTGNKTDPSKLRVDDIFKTSMCPLAKVMRHELRKRDIKKLKVVYSIESPVELKGPHEEELEDGKIKRYPGSVMMVPASAGLLLAAEVIRGLLN